MKTIRLEAIIEKGRDMISVRLESKGKLLIPNGWGDTVQQAFQNLIEMIEDYQAHEGKNDKYWSKVDAKKIEFDLRYDLQVFFEEHDYLNITAIAKRAGLNPGLVRQYSSGVKHPSLIQAKKLEVTIHKLAKDMERVSLYAA